MHGKRFLRLKDLSNRFDADVFYNLVFDQIAAQALKRPARVVEPEQTWIGAGDGDDAVALFLCKDRRTPRRLAAAQAV